MDHIAIYCLSYEYKTGTTYTQLVREFGIGISLSSGNPTQMKEVSEVGRDEEGTCQA